MMTDPIADMLTRLRNANAIQLKTVDMPASREKVGLAEALLSEGFIAGYEVEPGEPRSTLRLKLKYGPDGERVIRSIERVSKPGRRVYGTPGRLPKVVRGQGVYVLSTNQGILSDRAARRQKVGGEVLCRVF
ncbi:MAG TPA: 30S ribosomal protein S8 [Planctomycetota bacterium]|nr:30S ribosomal protein S8 [Planctomycetota bacterium]